MIREIESSKLPIRANLSEAYRAAVAQYSSLSPMERSRLRDELGLNDEYDRQERKNLVNGLSEAAKGHYSTITTISGVVTGLGAAVLTFLALNSKTNMGWITKGLASFGAGIAGAVAGGFVSSEALIPMRQVALGDAMNRAFDQGNEEFERVLAARMIERQQTISSAENPTPPSQDMAAKYSTPRMERHLAREERKKDLAAPRTL